MGTAVSGHRQSEWRKRQGKLLSKLNALYRNNDVSLADVHVHLAMLMVALDELKKRLMHSINGDM